MSLHGVNRTLEELVSNLVSVIAWKESVEPKLSVETFSEPISLSKEVILNKKQVDFDAASKKTQKLRESCETTKTKEPLNKGPDKNATVTSLKQSKRRAQSKRKSSDKIGGSKK